MLCVFTLVTGVQTCALPICDRFYALRVYKIFDIEGDARFDAELWAWLVEMGVPAIFVPEAHGGLGLAMVDLAIVSELFGTYAAPVPWLGHALATVAIVLGGSEAQKARWLPRLASGEVLATVAFAEGKRDRKSTRLNTVTTAQHECRHRLVKKIFITN